MIKILTVLLISLSPSTANAQKMWECPSQCLQVQIDGFNTCARIASMFKQGSDEFNSAWYACVTKLTKSEKYKQCQDICEPKESNEPTGTR